MGEQDERAPGVEPDDAPRDTGNAVFSRRAANVFLAFAVLALVGLLLVVGFGPGQAEPAAVLLAIGIAGASGLGSYTVSAGLSRGRPWAPAVAVAVLWVVTIAGVLGAIVDLAVSKVTIPLDAILAAWALSAADRPVLRVRGAALAAAAIAIVLVGPRFIDPVATIARSATATESQDLLLSLGSNCFGPADRSSGQILVTIEWEWTRTDPFADGGDAIELRWSEGDPVVVLDAQVTAPAGVTVVPWPYDVDTGPDPALALLVQESPGDPAVRFSLTRAAADAGGRITIPFEPTSAGPAALTFGARYARETDWRIAAATPCSLPLPPTSP